MSEANVTVTGYVGTTPALHLSPNGVQWTSFRVASTRRMRDATTGEWRDGKTAWFTVKVFRGAARTVCDSIVRGQPVVLTGRLSVEEWTDNEGRDRFALVVDADAIGPDATRGLTRFTKVIHDSAGPQAGQVSAQPSGWELTSAPDDARSLAGPAAPSSGAGDLAGDGLTADDLTADGLDEAAAAVVDELTGESTSVGR